MTDKLSPARLRQSRLKHKRDAEKQRTLTRLRHKEQLLVWKAEFEAHRMNDEFDRTGGLNSPARKRGRPPKAASEPDVPDVPLNREPDLLGFQSHCKSLVIKKKEGGLATLGEVMRPNQRAFLQRVAEYREAKKPIQWIELKCRQFVSMSTTVAAILASDTMLNSGFDSLVTAQDDDSLDKISAIYRYMFGRTKKEGKALGKAARMGDRLFTSPLGSAISLQVADANLGKSGSVTGMHVSEAGYILDWTEAYRSMQPSLTDAWWRFWILETTLKRNNPGDFRDFIDGVLEGQFPPWEVHFTAWHANPDLADYGEGLADFCQNPPDYERELVEKLGLKWAQAYWYYKARVGGMLGSYEAMMEAYPSTLHEALFMAGGAGFFSNEALRWYTNNLRQPIQRLKMTSSGLRPFEPGDSPMNPHVEVYEAPIALAKYRIGADCADSDERVAVEGSENAGLVVNEDTGKLVAVYHGYASANEFADVLDCLSARHNDADMTIEWNNAGRAVISRLREVHRRTNLYQRETFRYGQAQGVVDGAYGFDTRGTTRGILLDRLQLGINNRLWDIPSKYVLDCVKVLGKRGGAKARRGKGNLPDDGAIALALTGVGHSKLTDKLWQPWDLTAEKAVEIAEPVAPARRGYRIMGDNRERWRINEWGILVKAR